MSHAPTFISHVHFDGGAENAGHEIAGHENAGYTKAKQETSSEVANV